MPRRHRDEDDNEELEIDVEPEDEDVYPGDTEDWTDFSELQHDRDDYFGAFLDGLDHMDDIFDYPDDDDWYSET